MERRIMVIDGESNRLAATTHVLSTLYPDATIESSRWAMQRVREFAMEKAREILAWTTEQRASLVATNIDGIEEFLIQRIVEGYNGAIHCVITSCYDRRDTVDALSQYGLALSPNLAHVECPSVAGLLRHATRDEGHRARLERHFSSLPPGHPFSIGSRSTTYSTALPETYAASNR